MQSCEHARSPSDRERLSDRGAAPRSVGRIVSTSDGRLLYVAGQRPDLQQAVKELARGMSSSTNIHWARLKRKMRYLVNKQTSIWKFEPTINEARDNELTAASDSDWEAV